MKRKKKPSLPRQPDFTINCLKKNKGEKFPRNVLELTYFFYEKLKSTDIAKNLCLILDVTLVDSVHEYN